MHKYIHKHMHFITHYPQDFINQIPCIFPEFPILFKKFPCIKLYIEWIFFVITQPLNFIYYMHSNSLYSSKFKNSLHFPCRETFQVIFPVLWVPSIHTFICTRGCMGCIVISRIYCTLYSLCLLLCRYKLNFTTVYTNWK
jgi:hypothetical protein